MISFSQDCGRVPATTSSDFSLLTLGSSKISLHRAKADYNYPTIRLPSTFSKLAGLQTRIYQTVHDGALASLVVISSAGTKKVLRNQKTPVQAQNPPY
ncbi:MAG: hypothetical protein WAL97_01735 [Halobacteriota archaeon]|jgi:hypothetical protein